MWLRIQVRVLPMAFTNIVVVLGAEIVNDIAATRKDLTFQLSVSVKPLTLLMPLDPIANP